MPSLPGPARGFAAPDFLPDQGLGNSGVGGQGQGEDGALAPTCAGVGRRGKRGKMTGRRGDGAKRSFPLLWPGLPTGPRLRPQVSAFGEWRPAVGPVAWSG